MLGFLKRGFQKLAQGASGPLRGGFDQSLIVMDAHARFQEAVMNGAVWIGSNPAGTPVTTQAGLSATTPALTLYNPPTSQVALVLWSFGAAVQAAPAAAAAIMLAANLPSVASVVTGPTATTLGAVTNALLNYNSGVVAATGGPIGQCYRVATLIAAPIAFRQSFGTSGAAAIGGMSFRDAIDGAVVIPPGVAVSVQTSSAASLVCDFCWEEVPWNF